MKQNQQGGKTEKENVTEIIIEYIIETMFYNHRMYGLHGDRRDNPTSEYINLMLGLSS